MQYDLVGRIVERGIATVDEIRGCQSDAIGRIAVDQAVRLPQAYVDVMERIGGWAGKLYMWVDFHYPAVLGAKGRAAVVLTEGGSDYRLPSDALVFSLYDQSDEFTFVRTSQGDDPPVYFYGARYSPVPIRVFETFSAYIEHVVERWGEELTPEEIARYPLVDDPKY